MPNIVTGIAPRYDAEGNYHLEVTGDDGSTFEVLLPPKMEFQTRTVIQENEARRAAAQSGLFGYMVLDVTKIEGADPSQATDPDPTLIVGTKQLGLWGLRLPDDMARRAILALQMLLGGEGRERQIH